MIDVGFTIKNVRIIVNKFFHLIVNLLMNFIKAALFTKPKLKCKGLCQLSNKQTAK